MVSDPVSLEAKGRCPLEDIGGPHGYQELLEALSDPDHERREEFEEWTDMTFDPNVVDTRKLVTNLAALAKKWSRKTAVKGKPAK